MIFLQDVLGWKCKTLALFGLPVNRMAGSSRVERLEKHDFRFSTQNCSLLNKREGLTKIGEHPNKKYQYQKELKPPAEIGTMAT